MSDDDFDVADCESDHVDSGSDAPAVKTRRRRRRNPVVSAAVSLSCVFLAIGDKPSECNEIMEMFAKCQTKIPILMEYWELLGSLLFCGISKRKMNPQTTKLRQAGNWSC